MLFSRSSVTVILKPVVIFQSAPFDRDDHSFLHKTLSSLSFQNTTFSWFTSNHTGWNWNIEYSLSLLLVAPHLSNLLLDHSKNQFLLFFSVFFPSVSFPLDDLIQISGFKSCFNLFADSKIIYSTQTLPPKSRSD